MVSLGIRNSRIKDLFDIDYLARNGRFDRAVLVEAVRRSSRGVEPRSRGSRRSG
jgi:hypothetical protein